jgi:hypothetical protein
LAKCAAHTLPPISRASAYCCLLRQPNRAPAKHTSNFVAKNIKTRCSLRTPPPLHFHHPPSPGAPLNWVQRVRSRSREDIEGGGLGDSKVINIIIYLILFYYYFQHRVADLPPLQFHHRPSPGVPLNCVQCIRSRSREDIEGGGLGDSR